MTNQSSTLHLVEGTNGRPVGYGIDPDTNQFYTVKNAVHNDCIYSKHIYMLWSDPTAEDFFAKNPQANPNCQVCGKPLIKK